MKTITITPKSIVDGQNLFFSGLDKGDLFSTEGLGMEDVKEEAKKLISKLERRGEKDIKVEYNEDSLSAIISYSEVNIEYHP